MTRSAAHPAGSLIPPRYQMSLGEQVVKRLTMLAVLALLIGVGLILRFLVLPIVLAMVITYVFSPLADSLENHGFSRSTAVMVCFGILLGGFGMVAMGTWPSLETWLQEAPAKGETSAFELQLEHRLDQWQAALSAKYLQVDWQTAFQKLRHFLQHQRRSLMEEMPAMVLALLSQAGSAVLALIIAFFVLVDGSAMKRAVVAWVPNRHFENALTMLDRVDRKISAYLIGTAVENILVTVILAIPLYLLGMPNAFLFACIFGLANVIPFVGPFIGGAAGVLFAMLDPASPSIGALLAVYIVVHLIDAMLISPLVMGKSLDMHPLTVILGISVGGTLGGVAGMLVSVPLIAITKAVVTTVIEGLRNAATD